jgi:hypothetical protein
MAILPVSNASIQNTYLTAYTSNENYLGRFVEWVREDRPWYQQAFVYTAVVLAMLALTVTVVGIPLIIQAIYENDKLAVQSLVNAGDKEVFEQFGGREQFERIPHRTIKHLNWDNFQEISPRSMHESLERTTDEFNRPGVLMRIRDSKTQRVFVQAIFRKFVYEPIWDYTHGPVTIFTGDRIDASALEKLGQIIGDKHRRYSLY